MHFLLYSLSFLLSCYFFSFFPRYQHSYLVNISIEQPTVVTGNPTFISSILEFLAPTTFDSSVLIGTETNVFIGNGATITISGEFVLSDDSKISVNIGDGSGELLIVVSECIQLGGDLVVNVDKIEPDREYTVRIFSFLFFFLLLFSLPPTFSQSLFHASILTGCSSEMCIGWLFSLS